MTRTLIACLAAAFVGGWTSAQDMGGGAPAQDEEKACDLSKVELREYCSGCKAWPSSEQVDKGACKKCKTRVEKVETCVKIYWDCPKMHEGKSKRHAKNCCASKTCCKETPSLALVWRGCDACKAKALKEAEFKHANDTCTGKTRKLCGESTKFPHGGAED